METIIGAVVGVELGWLGNWWSSRGMKRILAELPRKIDLIEIALEPRGMQTFGRTVLSGLSLKLRLLSAGALALRLAAAVVILATLVLGRVPGAASAGS